MKAKTLSVLLLLAVVLAIPMVMAVQPGGTKLVSKDHSWNVQKPYGKFAGVEIQYLNKVSI